MNIIDLGSAPDRLDVPIAAVPDEVLGRPKPGGEYRFGDPRDHIAGLSVDFGGAATEAAGRWRRGLRSRPKREARAAR